MLPKKYRLNLKVNFRFVASGIKKETANFKVMYKFGTNTKPLVGIAISSQVFKKANLRNKAKRLSSKSIEPFYFSLIKNINLVIMPKLGVLTEDQETLSKEIRDVKDLYNSD